MKTEPLVTVASITAGITALLALLVAFGVDLTEDQTAAILGVAAVAAPLLVAALVRSRVSPVPPGGTRRRPADVGPEAGVYELGITLIVLGVGLVVLDAFILTSVALTALGIALIIGGVVLAVLRR